MKDCCMVREREIDIERKTGEGGGGRGKGEEKRFEGIRRKRIKWNLITHVSFLLHPVGRRKEEELILKR